MKTCFKCLQSLPLEAFYKHSRMGDGHLGKCKECTKTDVKKHRLEKLEHIRAYDRMRASKPHRKELAKRLQMRWKAEFPNRKRASSLVASALRSGRLKKMPCWVCGEARSEAHHPDYEEPLDVVWLCRIHHSETHHMVANDSQIERAA